MQTIIERTHFNSTAGRAGGDPGSAPLWFVAHTRPRREKKVVEYCRREGLSAILPCYRAAHEYRRKKVVFHKPLFPGYVFLYIAEEHRGKVRQNDHVANLLVPPHQESFISQLDDILKAVETDLELRLVPSIGLGMRVRIKSGPLRDVEGWVEERFGPSTVLLRLDFIGQAAAVKIDATNLELI